MEAVPKTFNWVKARSQCSLQRLFTLLAEVVDSDVKAIQHLSKAPYAAVFKLDRPSDSKLVVTKVLAAGGIQSGEHVVFELEPDGISAKRGRTQDHLFLAKPSLMKDGECRLEIDREPLELWQVSRKALEDLFFAL